CGPCIGQWARHTNDPNRKNSIITSFNRNFAKRNDGNPNTHAFVASPEITTAFAIAGDLTFNPLTDTLINDEGMAVKLEEPSGDQFPPRGFDVKDPGYIEPAKDGSKVSVKIDPQSNRLQALSPFPAWDGKNLTGMKLLIKAKGKCTTDHISMAGPWLRFRGHLDNIANNTLTGAVNYFNEKTDSVKNQLTGEYGPVPSTQRAYKAAGIPTIVVGDHNYGEGSSREHAAMQPRHLGIRAILVKSFARIHETNLKKQGMLGITFSNESDYDLIQEDDTIDIVDLSSFSPDRQLTVALRHKDGTSDTIKVNHTYNAGQIEWFRAGSALNLMAKDITAKEGFKQPVVNKAPAKKAAKVAGKKTLSKPEAKKLASKTLAKQAKKPARPSKKTAKPANKTARPAKKGLVKKALSKVVKLAKKVKKVVSKKKTTARNTAAKKVARKKKK
ncbi:MAG: aconitase family protein, partial [Bacteroidota bacterium]|nr:aconitase family protein [Bacteroidota bacterium]